MNQIDQHKNELNLICKKCHVNELYAFGSVLDKSRFNQNSDIDLIVKFDDKIAVEDYADLYFNLAEDLELLFNRKVDLMTSKPIRNKYLRESINLTKQIVYAA